MDLHGCQKAGVFLRLPDHIVLLGPLSGKLLALLSCRLCFGSGSPCLAASWHLDSRLHAVLLPVFLLGSSESYWPVDSVICGQLVFGSWNLQIT